MDNFTSISILNATSYVNDGNIEVPSMVIIFNILFYESFFILFQVSLIPVSIVGDKYAEKSVKK